MPVTIFRKAPEGEDLDDLHYELIGVVDVAKAYQDYSAELLHEFFIKDHPAKTHYLKPCLMKRLVEDDNHAPFAIFIATPEINPQSNRPLVKREDIIAFQEKYPFVHLESTWCSWLNVVTSYPDYN